MAEVTRKLACPSVPRYIFYEGALPGRKQEGWTVGEKIHIADLSNDVLAELGAEWTNSLIDRAGKLRKQLKDYP